MGKFSSLSKLAIAAGPAVIKMVQRYGPTIKQMVDSNPEAVDNIKGKIQKYGEAKKKSGVSGAQKRVEVLREQVTYLYASANTPEVADNAQKWGKELDRIEVALPLIDAMSPKNRRLELRKVDDKIDTLSSRILATVVQDEVEDAEVVIDDQEREQD